MNSSNGAILLDVTIRDGGYVNKHSWTTAQAIQIVSACATARIPFVEVGYLRPHRHGTDGTTAPSASCPPEYLARAEEAAQGTRPVVMAHAKDTTPEQLAGVAKYGVALVRMPTRPQDVALLEPYVEAAHAAGMAFAVNLIRVSELDDDSILRAVADADRLAVDIFYLADSNGSLFPEDVARLGARVRAATDLTLGFHLHDGISMGFSNALAAMREGFQYIDASLAGMGKGGGNLSLELITAYLRSREHYDFAVTPLVETAAELLTPWRGNQIIAKCESIASGILDLNLEALEVLRADDSRQIFSILDGSSSVL